MADETDHYSISATEVIPGHRLIAVTIIQLGEPDNTGLADALLEHARNILEYMARKHPDALARTLDVLSPYTCMYERGLRTGNGTSIWMCINLTGEQPPNPKQSLEFEKFCMGVLQGAEQGARGIQPDKPATTAPTTDPNPTQEHNRAAAIGALETLAGLAVDGGSVFVEGGLDRLLGSITPPPARRRHRPGHNS